MPRISIPARLRLTFVLVFLSGPGFFACAHKAGDSSTLDEHREPPAPSEAAAPPSLETSMISETADPLPMGETCATWRQQLRRPVKIHLKTAFPDPPEALLSLLEGDEDIEAIGARLLAETERRVGACVQPRSAEEDGHLRVAGEDGVFRVGLRLEQPCAVDEVGEIAGDFCLELSPAEGGGARYTLSIGDLMLGDLRLGDVLLHLQMDQETRIPHFEVFVSMDRLPGNLPERLLAPLVPYLEAGTRAFRGLFDIGLHVLARILVDVMDAGGYRSDAPQR